MLSGDLTSQKAARKVSFLCVKKVPFLKEVFHTKLWNGKIIGEERNVSSFLIIAE
jgi:hypothetical protein